MVQEEEIFSRAERLLGDKTMARIAEKRVIVFGVGGVGSWCAEGLVRSGIRHLTIVDNDCVAVTNINRQLMATTETIGQVKVEALREHLLTVNPHAEITALQKFFSKDTAGEFCLNGYDYVIDAIDSLKDKAELILTASQSTATLFSSMGAALKMDPTRIRVAEFWKVHGDPLARALRKKLKHWGVVPEKKFLCVYSEELLENNGNEDPCDDGQPQGYKKAQLNGSVVHVTASFGFALAGLVLKDITSN